MFMKKKKNVYICKQIKYYFVFENSIRTILLEPTKNLENKTYNSYFPILYFHLNLTIKILLFFTLILKYLLVFNAINILELANNFILSYI